MKTTSPSPCLCASFLLVVLPITDVVLRAATRQLDLSEAVVVVSQVPTPKGDVMRTRGNPGWTRARAAGGWPGCTTCGGQQGSLTTVDPNARYMVRLTGNGASPLRGDGVRLPATKRAKGIGQFQEFTVPAALTVDGALRLTWDAVDESHLNWQLHSHVAEVWLLKRVTGHSARP